MTRIGDIVTILITHHHRNRLEIEGTAVVIAATGAPNHFLVCFHDSGEVCERYVDPVAQLIGAQIYVAKINWELRAVADVATPNRWIARNGGGRSCRSSRTH